VNVFNKLLHLSFSLTCFCFYYLFYFH